MALADIERAYSETEVALAQVVSRNDKELFFNGDKALRAHLQKNLDYYRIRRDGVRALLASAPPAVWQPIETADRSSAAINRRIWGVVNGETRLIAYGFSSHTKWLTWCLADQGVEDFDTCTPTHWQPYIVPSPPTPGGTKP